MSERSLKDCATFRSTLPEDAEWNEKGDPVVPGGKGVAAALGQILENHGFQPTEPSQHSYYGRQIEIRTPECRVECIVQDLDPWVLLTTCKSRLFKRKEGDRFHVSVLSALVEGLEADERFTEVYWASRKQLAEEGKFKA